MPNTPTRVAGDLVPRALVVIGRPYGVPPVCIECHGPIDTSADYWVLLDQAPGRTAQILAAAHCCDPDADSDQVSWGCADGLLEDWELVLADDDIHLLVLGSDGGGPRFFAGPEPIHAGTPAEVLTAEGVWLAGRFEYDLWSGRPKAAVYVELAGWGQVAAPLTLPVGTVIRLSGR